MFKSASSSTASGMTRRAVLAAAGGMAASLAAPAFAANTYPSRPIRFVVPFSAGGATDILARLIAEHLRSAWNVPVVVENIVGASGNIGSFAVARAEPDGYTLLMGAIGTNAVNASLFDKMPYDTATAFAPISQVAQLPMALVVHPSVPAKSVAELIALAKQKPKSLNHGSAGKGASQHLASVLFESMTGTQFEQVFYRGAAAMVPDLLSGRVQLSFGDLGSLRPHIQSGAVRPLAVTTSKQSPLLPKLPTISEAVPGYDVAAWYGMFAPARTPPAVVAKINAEVIASLKTPTILERLESIGAEPVGSSPEAFAAFVRNEMQRWAKVVEAAGIKAS